MADISEELASKIIEISNEIGEGVNGAALVCDELNELSCEVAR